MRFVMPEEACQAEAFLYDKSRTQAENTARLGEMLVGLSVSVQPGNSGDTCGGGVREKASRLTAAV